MTNDYAQALNELSDHIQKYDEDIMSYLGALMLALDSDEPDSTFDHIRRCEEHKRIIDERDVLKMRVAALRPGTLDAKDHPMYTGETAQEKWDKKEAWEILLDDRNFDRARGTTLEEKARIDKSYRLLDAQEELDRRERLKEESAVIKAVTATLSAQPDRQREIVENVRKMGYGIK